MSRSTAGEGDVFIGVRMPAIRAAIKPFRELGLDEIAEVLASPVHEHRMAALDGFLRAHAHEMPRTALRYSIEKLTPERRKYWLVYSGSAGSIGKPGVND